MKTAPIIWVLWGMWPYASLRCYQIILDESRNHITWGKNHNFPHILIDNIPVKELTNSLTHRDETVATVRDEYRSLRDMWATIFLMACNTMHLYVDEIFESWPDITNLSLIYETVREICNLGHQRVGILWSLTTIQSGLYQNALTDAWVNVVVLSDLSLLEGINTIIKKVIGGDIQFSSDEYALMYESIELLRWEWATGIVLGCTELPIAFVSVPSPLPLYDPLFITVRRACECYYKGRDSTYCIFGAW